MSSFHSSDGHLYSIPKDGCIDVISKSFASCSPPLVARPSKYVQFGLVGLHSPHLNISSSSTHPLSGSKTAQGGDARRRQAGSGAVRARNERPRSGVGCTASPTR